MEKRKIFIVIFICFSFLNLPAQEVKEKPKVKKKAPEATSSIADQPATDTLITDIRIAVFPEFYHYWPVDVNDTLFRYQCYDAQNNPINVDTLHNINDVRHIYLVKSFTNYTHTFIGPDGKPSASLVNKTLYTYDKTDADTWNSTDNTSHFQAQLKEYKSEIVRTDTTTVADEITQSKQLTVRKYYKVVSVNAQFIYNENEDSK